MTVKFLRHMWLSVFAVIMMAAVLAHHPHTVFAQDADSEVLELTSSEVLLGDDLPSQVRLSGLTMVWQDFNRCAAAAVTMQISYWRDAADYRESVSYLNPDREDMSVRLEEMVSLASEYYELQGIERAAGTIDLVRTLVANGFPVLVKNSYYDGGNWTYDWMSHNRVVIGYNDDLREFYAFDSLLGSGPENNGRAFDFDDFDERWKGLNRVYLVLYEPEDEDKVREILSDQWDLESNAAWNLEQVMADLEEDPDSFDRFNLGTALTALGRYEEAAQAYDEARAVGLPWRMLWYQFGPLEAYLQTGRYEEVIALTRQTVNDAPGIEESYYYIARAYLGLGETDRAVRNLEAALWRNPRLMAARDLLNELTADEAVVEN